MGEPATILPTLGHCRGGGKVVITLPATAAPATKYRVSFRSVFDRSLCSTANASEVKNGLLECILPDHGRTDVTDVTVVDAVHTDSTQQHQYKVSTQFQFQDNMSLKLCYAMPISCPDFRYLLVSLLTLPIEEVLQNYNAVDAMMVSAMQQRPPLITSIEVKSLFEGCRLCYNNDKANLFHFAAEFGLPRFAEILTTQSAGIKYSLKAELFRRTSHGNTPLAMAKKNPSSCGKEVKAVLADAIAEFNESKHDKGRSAKKEKMRDRAQSTPSRLPNSVIPQQPPLPTVDCEEGGAAGPGVGVQRAKSKRKFWGKKVSNSQVKSECVGATPVPVPGAESLLYHVAVLNISTESDSDSSTKHVDRTTIHYYWNNALAFVQATADCAPKSRKMLPLKMGDVAIVTKRGGGGQAGDAHGMVNNAEIGQFSLSHVKRISKAEAQTALGYHPATRQSTSLPTLEPPQETLPAASNKDDGVISEYEVMERPSSKANGIQEDTVRWYRVTHQAEVTRDFEQDMDQQIHVDYLPLQMKDVVNVVCMPDREEWALVEHRGRVGRALYATLRALSDTAEPVRMKPTYMDARLGNEALQPGDMIAVGITYSNQLKISAVLYGKDTADSMTMQPSSTLQAAGKQQHRPEVIYDSPETADCVRKQFKKRSTQHHNGGDGGGGSSSGSTQDGEVDGEVGTGFDCGSDTSVQSSSSSVLPATPSSKGTAEGQGSGKGGHSLGLSVSPPHARRKQGNPHNARQPQSDSQRTSSHSRGSTGNMDTTDSTNLTVKPTDASGSTRRSDPNVHSSVMKAAPEVASKPQFLYRTQSVDTALDTDGNASKFSKVSGVGKSAGSRTSPLQSAGAKVKDTHGTKHTDHSPSTTEAKTQNDKSKSGKASSSISEHRLSLKSAPSSATSHGQAKAVTSKPRPASISGLKSSSRDPPPLSPKPTSKKDTPKSATLPAGSQLQQGTAPSASKVVVPGALPPSSFTRQEVARLDQQQFPIMKVDLPMAALRKR
ncbi:uncharacterized protein LOC135821819 isoform X2 [Sycon ciliatum]|uniref:uncharacterized protein LOC135821819 isoform X2 n=1 Tax=Sycon ciliatum TaxID=27933 RepID=UPI0031F69517